MSSKRMSNTIDAACWNIVNFDKSCDSFARNLNIFHAFWIIYQNDWIVRPRPFRPINHYYVIISLVKEQNPVDSCLLVLKLKVNYCCKQSVPNRNNERRQIGWFISMNDKNRLFWSRERPKMNIKEKILFETGYINENYSCSFPVWLRIWGDLLGPG